MAELYFNLFPHYTNGALVHSSVTDIGYYVSRDIRRAGTLPMTFQCHSERYVQTLKKLKQRIRRVRPNRKMNQVVLLHDNARPHTSLRTREATATMGRTVLPHPLYSPDLAPSDFHLFGPWRMRSEDAVLRTTTNWNTACVKSSDASPKSLTQRWKKCVDNEEEFVKK
jgi:histone-lysine N-methyltransferase SETMAR